MKRVSDTRGDQEDFIASAATNAAAYRTELADFDCGYVWGVDAEGGGEELCHHFERGYALGAFFVHAGCVLDFQCAIVKYRRSERSAFGCDHRLDLLKYEIDAGV